jgi:KipI family sensor histidine kinase inhibitor
MPSPSFLAAGDSAIAVSFGDGIRADLNDAVIALDRSLCEKPLAGVLETLPTYRSLLVLYDPRKLGYPSMVRALRRRLASLARASRAASSGGGLGGGEARPRIVELPVRYGGAYGEDLPDVARNAGLSEDEVIARHSAREYRIYMLGFLPGFAYLGGLDPSIATPRLETPRKAIPAGSVGIGGEQTGIYPLVSPGGWRLIGRTPLKPYDPEREEAFLYRAGDSIRFRPIGDAEFEDLAAAGSR